MKTDPAETILIYGIPAYGHLYVSLVLAGRLRAAGARVFYYSTEAFRDEIEASGCVFRPYPFRQEELELRDGARLLKLYRLLLEYTERMLPGLLREAGAVRPAAVLFDSLALWGRAVSGLLQVRGYSIYHVAAVRRPFDAGFFAYAKGFSAGFLKDAGELRPAMRARGRLKRRYCLKRLGLLPVLMNPGIYNLAAYSERFQPGGRRFGARWLFLGPLAVHRKNPGSQDAALPAGPLIYVSLGTIFNQDEALLDKIIEVFGKGRTPVVLVWDTERTAGVELPSNFTVRRFVDQTAVLKRAVLFVTAGGMNSIHEALYYGVPCLFCPQQGEQALNAERFERLGFGRILRDRERLGETANEVLKLPASWDETLKRELVQTRAGKAAHLILKGPPF